MKKEAYFKMMGLDKKAWGPSEVLAEPAPDYIKDTAKMQANLAKRYFDRAYKELPNKQRYKYLIGQGASAKSRADSALGLYKKKLSEQKDLAKSIGENYRWLTRLLTPNKWFKEY